MPDRMIIFDMDGVLVDVSDSYRETISQTVESFTGRTVSRDLIQDYKNRGGFNNDWLLSQQIIADFGLRVDYDTVVESFQKLFLGNGTDGLIYRERWIAEPGLLERLSTRFQMAIFTGRLREEANLTLRRFALNIRFHPIIAEEDVHNGKPAPDGLLKICELFPGCKCWYIGDTVDDARCAKAGGVPFIGVANPRRARYSETVTLLRDEGATGVVGDINDLESVLV